MEPTKKLENCMSIEIFDCIVDNAKNPLEDGIQTGQAYEKIPYEYLRGLLTVTTPIYGCMIEKYSKWNGDRIYINGKCIDTFNTVRQRISQGVDLSFFPDDIYLIVKAEEKLYVLAFCKFIDNRFICCLNIKDVDIAVERLAIYIESYRNQGEKNTGNFLDLPINNIEPKRDFWKSYPTDVEEF